MKEPSRKLELHSNSFGSWSPYPHVDLKVSSVYWLPNSTDVHHEELLDGAMASGTRTDSFASQSKARWVHRVCCDRQVHLIPIHQVPHWLGQSVRVRHQFGSILWAGTVGTATFRRKFHLTLMIIQSFDSRDVMCFTTLFERISTLLVHCRESLQSGSFNTRCANHILVHRCHMRCPSLLISCSICVTQVDRIQHQIAFEAHHCNFFQIDSGWLRIPRCFNCESRYISIWASICYYLNGASAVTKFSSPCNSNLKGIEVFCLAAK